MFDIDSNLSTGKKKEPASGRLFLSGGVGEIRTLEELLTPTRFPIVRSTSLILVSLIVLGKSLIILEWVEFPKK